MTKEDTRILLYGKRRQITHDRVMEMSVTTLLVAGIVNPYGPTLNAVVVAGMPKFEVRLPIIKLMLNPFNQEVEEVGEITFGKKWDPSAVIPQLFDLPFGACPTLLLPNKHLENDRSISLHAEFLCRFADARSDFDRVRKYFGNPWDRVSAEMREAAHRIVKQKIGGKGTEVEVEPLNQEESAEFAGLLLSEQHMKSELQAFLYAWNGSIQHIGPSLASMNFNTFKCVFAHLASSCRLPDLSV